MQVGLDPGCRVWTQFTTAAQITDKAGVTHGVSAEARISDAVLAAGFDDPNEQAHQSTTAEIRIAPTRMR